MTISRLARSLIIIALLSGMSLGQILSFDSPTSPGAVPGASNPEGWASAGGTVTVAPFGGLATPVSGFPSDGDQWCIVSAEGATGGLTSPAGGPAPYPFTPGATGHLLSQPIQIPSVSEVVISFDWTYVSAECPNDAVYNDFFTVDLVDSNGVVLDRVLYRDTFSASLVPGAATPNESGVVPAGACVPSEEAPFGTMKTEHFAVNWALLGMLVHLQVHVGNGGDDGFSSYAHIDNIRLDTVRFPGSLQDFEILTGLDGPVNSQDVKPVEGGELLTMEFNSAGTFHGAPLIIFVQQFPSIAYPGPTPGFPEFQVNLLQPYFALTTLPGAFLGYQTLPPGGFTLAATLGSAPGYAGQSFLLQGAVLSAASPVGFATTNGHELAYAHRVYVSASTGAPGNPGTESAPLSTIADGFAQAVAIGASEMWVAEATYNEPSLIIDSPVSMRGGFDAQTWTHTNTTNSVVLLPAEGMRFASPPTGNSCPTVVSGFDFHSATATQPAGASIAVTLHYCNALTFENCKFTAGQGGFGAIGANGTPGLSGNAGSGGGDGEDEGQVIILTSPGSGGAGGLPGGGFGGYGGDVTVLMPLPGVWGGTASSSATCPNGAPGGSFGLGCQRGAVPAGCPSAGGGPGWPGNDGYEGAGGTIGGFPGGGVLANGDWHPGAPGLDGLDGPSGCPGGGGGGGGAALTPTVTSFGINHMSGGGGGGGGAGGLPGQGGLGGGPGGASFATYLFHSSPTFVSCTFVSDWGGTGGPGGDGGAGGAGGAGGPGGAGGEFHYILFALSWSAGAGGPGGVGGLGGGGGGGGGGNGGPSHCVWVGFSGSNPVGLTDPSNTFQPGPPGIPGPGGWSGNNGLPGSVGMRAADGQWGTSGITN